MNFIAKTFHNFEEILADEIIQIGGNDVKILKRAVSFSGDKALLYKANLLLRTALRILIPIAEFETHNAESLYKNIKKIEWAKYFTVELTFAIDAKVNSDNFDHSGFVALKAKDAIADHFREETGERPSVDTKDPDLLIHIHLSNTKCTVLLDSSGEPLFKRGYRSSGSKAPLNEVLAAGMILLSGWDKETDFYDPMCGSGTLLLEAAMIATNTPPGLYRAEFSFEKWLDFDIELWEDIIYAAEAKIDLSKTRLISGSDISPLAIGIAKRNIDNTKFKGKIDVATKSFEDSLPLANGTFVITNPPYGERLNKSNINNLYSTFGTRLKHHYANSVVWILSSNKEALKHVGLRPEEKITLYNGGLECSFNKYSIFDGTLKDNKSIKA